MDSFRESFNAAVENAVDKVRDMACTDSGPSSMAYGRDQGGGGPPKIESGYYSTGRMVGFGSDDVRRGGGGSGAGSGGHSRASSHRDRSSYGGRGGYDDRSSGGQPYRTSSDSYRGSYPSRAAYDHDEPEEGGRDGRSDSYGREMSERAHRSGGYAVPGASRDYGRSNAADSQPRHPPEATLAPKIESGYYSTGKMVGFGSEDVRRGGGDSRRLGGAGGLSTVKRNYEHRAAYERDGRESYSVEYTERYSRSAPVGREEDACSRYGQHPDDDDNDYGHGADAWTSQIELPSEAQPAPEPTRLSAAIPQPTVPKPRLPHPRTGAHASQRALPSRPRPSGAYPSSVARGAAPSTLDDFANADPEPTAVPVDVDLLGFEPEPDADPFSSSAAPDPFGSMPDPFGSASDPFASAPPDPFASASDQVPVPSSSVAPTSNDLFGASTADPFASFGEPFSGGSAATTSDLFSGGAPSDPFGAAAVPAKLGRQPASTPLPTAPLALFTSETPLSGTGAVASSVNLLDGPSDDNVGASELLALAAPSDMTRNASMAIAAAGQSDMAMLGSVDLGAMCSVDHDSSKAAAPLAGPSCIDAKDGCTAANGSKDPWAMLNKVVDLEDITASKGAPAAPAVKPKVAMGQMRTAPTAAASAPVGMAACSPMSVGCGIANGCGSPCGPTSPVGLGIMGMGVPPMSVGGGMGPGMTSGAHFCSNCGAKRTGGNFCSNCGAKF